MTYQRKKRMRASQRGRRFSSGAEIQRAMDARTSAKNGASAMPRNELQCATRQTITHMPSALIARQED